MTLSDATTSIAPDASNAVVDAVSAASTLLLLYNAASTLPFSATAAPAVLWLGV